MNNEPAYMKNDNLLFGTSYRIENCQHSETQSWACIFLVSHVGLENYGNNGSLAFT